MEITVKKYITSLLTSTPLVMTMQQLNKDYRNTIGESIPYQKLGYNSLEHFLHSIPDTVRVKGGGPMGQVVPVIQEKSAHVNKLVSNQKIVRNKRHPCVPRKRMSIMYPPSYSSQTSHKIENVPQVTSTHRIEIPQVTSTHKIDSASQVTTKKMYYPVNKVTSLPNCPTHSASTYNPSPNVSPGNHASSTTTKDSRSNYTPPVANAMLRKPADILGNVKYFKKVEESVSEASFSNSPSPVASSRKWTTNSKRIVNDLDRISTNQIENSVPMQVRNNLRALIRQCPQGIWCAEIPERYRKMFRQELDYHELGFKSLIHLCVCLSSIFHYVRPSTDDYKLYDRSQPLPDCAEKNFTMASYGSINKSASDIDANCALPNVDWADMKKFLPMDIFMPGMEIPRAFVSHEVQESDEIDVIVGEIYDLSKFWVYVENSQLDTLMDNIQDFYRDHAQEYFIPDHLIREGIYCVQVIFGEYHRALIVDTMPEVQDTIRVIFIDYGTMTKVSTKGLCFLHIDFSNLEAQAIRCRLANVFPLEEGAPWTREACIAFRRLVVDKDITAKISHINWEEQYLEVYLADVTDKDNTFYLNDRLVEAGLAQSPDKERRQPLVDSIYKPIVKYLHLFPTFLELEHGLAPSTAEMEVFHQCNVPINFLYPQYFYVDQTGEEAVIRAAEEFHENHCFKEKRRTPSSQYFDREQFKERELDLSVFEELRYEIMAFVGQSAKEEPPFENSGDFVDAVEELVPKQENGCLDLNLLTDQLREINIKEEETVNVLKKDLIVTEDIMKDINSFFKAGDNGTSDLALLDPCRNGERTSDFSLFKKEWQQLPLVEDGVDCTVIKSEPLTSDDAELSCHPLSAMTFEDNRLSDEENASYGQSDEGSGSNYDLCMPDVHLEGIKISLLPEDHPLSIINRLKAESEHKIRSFLEDEALFEDAAEPAKEEQVKTEVIPQLNTNPFVNGSNGSRSGSVDLNIDVTKLNSNNPFLNFLQDDDKSSTGSTTSTVYDSPVVPTTQHSWSSFSDMSAETVSLLGKSLRSGSNTSSDSLKIFDDRRSCSTQTSDKQTKAVQVVESQCRYFYPPPQEYHAQAWQASHGGNPYYTMRFSNFQGYTLEAQRPACPPPPGFRPQGVFPGVGGFGPAPRFPSAQFGLQRPMCYYPAPPFAPSGVTSGAVGPSGAEAVGGDVRSGRDFYAVYNEQLRASRSNQ